MKRLFCLALAALTTFSVLSPLRGRAAEPSSPEFDGYLVRLKNTQDGLALLNADDGQQISDGLWLVDELETAQAMDELGLAAYYEPNYRLELLEGESDYTPAQWNLLVTGAQAAWNHTDEAGVYDARGDGVTIAVIDSGIYRAHPDFNQANILECRNLSGATGGVDSWHGTFVAGVIAAQVANGMGTDGITPNVTIMPICVTNGGYSSIALLVQAIDLAVDEGADVINLSIGGKNDSESMREACEKAMDAGVLLVAAAGNYKTGESKDSNTYMYPAAIEKVVSVSACKQEGDAVVFDDSYSYFNDQVTVSAPGTYVQSLYLDGGIAVRSGTSFAAPVVSAMAAMAKQRCPDIAQETFTQLLCTSAADLGDPGYDIYYGHGLVDILAFLDALDQRPLSTYYLAQYDAAGRMLAVEALPNGVSDLERTDILDEAETGKLFQLDASGAPLEAAQTILFPSES